ncbi:methyltransferase domain-containing protein [Alteromonas sp. MMG017]|uniref:putative RNA methyltransferase n=1 Tax=Alteromonas sp. MMG017 TaxID=2822692 RepID=UPI001B3A1424|nr:methyltransferase domain-containing protein [Alteromonas sp. MMG017]MBQ4830026.1 methyltransferase domain-containing protein [Alteromonas sp. MMG017]
MWQCPLCRSPIDMSASVIQCSNNHSFDKAKAGYVNLLPVQFKNSKSPGDDKSMVRARREFHDLNGYGPLKQRMADIVAQYYTDTRSSDNADINAKPELAIYDAGCGEGSYLNALVTGLEAIGIHTSGSGSDIAKIAVELAAKAYKSQQFVVASSFDLPIGSNTQDVVIQVFAPGSSEEYARVLKAGGLLLTVDPAPMHLFELKSLVYDNPAKHAVDKETRVGFEQSMDETVNYPLHFDNDEQKIALIKMTPYYWRLPPDRLAEIVEKLNQVTVDFRVQAWLKMPETA